MVGGFLTLLDTQVPVGPIFRSLTGCGRWEGGSPKTMPESTQVRPRSRESYSRRVL